MDNFILLPTGKPAQEGQLVLCQDGSLRQAAHNHTYIHPELPAQHLYQLSKEEIKEGDWMYLEEGETSKTSQGEIAQCVLPGIDDLKWVKVTRSTNPDLNLPLIPKEVVDEFTQEYNHVPA